MRYSRFDCTYHSIYHWKLIWPIFPIIYLPLLFSICPKRRVTFFNLTNTHYVIHQWKTPWLLINITHFPCPSNHFASLRRYVYRISSRSLIMGKFLVWYQWRRKINKYIDPIYHSCSFLEKAFKMYRCKYAEIFSKVFFIFLKFPWKYFSY